MHKTGAALSGDVPDLILSAARGVFPGTALEALIARMETAK
ncbi:MULTISPECIES: hypothetical protein [Tabrizicola]|nr:MULTISPECIES: hypothetical protein [Paracoccaceae]